MTPACTRTDPTTAREGGIPSLFFFARLDRGNTHFRTGTEQRSCSRQQHHRARACNMITPHLLHYLPMGRTIHYIKGSCSPRRFSSSHVGTAVRCAPLDSRGRSMLVAIRANRMVRIRQRRTCLEPPEPPPSRKESTHITLRERGTVCMAYCRAALLVRLTLGLAFCLAQRLSASASDDSALQDLTQNLRQRARGLLLLSEGARAAATHGMTATPVTAAGASVASAIGSAAASVVVTSRRVGGVGWLNSSGGSRRRGAERGSNWSSSSTKSVGAGAGEGRRALSLLTPAVAPRAGTSALFVVSGTSPAGAPARAREAYLSEADRARCRCVANVCCGRPERRTKLTLAMQMVMHETLQVW